MYSLFNNIYDPFPMFGKPSVYVISDSELARYKRAQAESEIIELDKLIDSHKQSIERLEKTRESIRAALPAAPEEAEKTTTLG